MIGGGFFEKSVLTAQYDAELDGFILALMAKHNVHAVGYALIENYKVAKVKTINAKIACDPFSLFQGCSFSKCVTTYAILDLVAQNKIQLDTPVNHYLESWKINGSSFDNNVTVRHCMNMTSGLCFGEPGTTFAGYTREAPIPVLSEILIGKVPATNPPVKIIFEPGSQYHYSGASYMVLQQLIEDVVKQPFETYMNRDILPKLGMNSSVFECPLGADKQTKVIPGYKNDGEKIEGGWHNIVSAASGGLWSCPMDIANFMLFVSKGFVDKNTVIQEMLSSHPNTDYGLGVVVNGSDASLNFRKNGHNSGYHNELIMFPNCGKGLVVMTNSSAGMQLINELITFVSDKSSWPNYRSDFNEIVSQPIKKMK